MSTGLWAVPAGRRPGGLELRSATSSTQAGCCQAAARTAAAHSVVSCSKQMKFHSEKQAKCLILAFRMRLNPQNKKKPETSQASKHSDMMGRARFELATLCLKGRYSTS